MPGLFVDPETALIERQQINSVPLLLSPAGAPRIFALDGRPHVSNAVGSILNTFQTLSVSTHFSVVYLCLSFDYPLESFLANFYRKITYRPAGP